MNSPFSNLELAIIQQWNWFQTDLAWIHKTSNKLPTSYLLIWLKLNLLWVKRNANVWTPSRRLKIAQLICNAVRYLVLSFCLSFNFLSKKKTGKALMSNGRHYFFYHGWCKVVQIKFEYFERLFEWKHIKMFIVRQKFFYRDFFTSSSTPDEAERNFIF